MISVEYIKSMTNRADCNQLISSIKNFKKEIESGLLGTKKECYQRINNYLEINKERYFQILHNAEKICLIHDIKE